MAPAAQADGPTAEVKTVSGELETVVCVSSDLNVRSDKLDTVLFTVKHFEATKVFQGWGDTKQTKVIDGKPHVFVKAQFPSREAAGKDSVGWIAEAFVKVKSECAGAVAVERAKLEAESRVRSSVQSMGLSDPSCCEFPLNARPQAAIDARGMHNFGWRRSGGARLHAACDLYRNLNDSVLSVAPGKVLRGLYYFYQNTYALEVRHSGGFVVRYGEVTGKSANGVGAGRAVEPGQTVGSVGKTSHPNPMLHFELYKGTASGSLSGGGKYQRRSDLLDPTEYLLKWQAGKFRDHR